MDYVLIPSYEPTEKLLKLIEELRAMRPDCRILVINDGSSSDYDALFLRAEALGAELLTHKKNKGKGAALKTGFAHLKPIAEFEAVVCADSDGQHKPKDIFLCLDKAHEMPNSMIIGTRKFTGHVPLRSRFGNTLTRLVYMLATDHSLYDTQTGLRAYASPLLEWLRNVQGDRFEYEMNQLLEAPGAGISFYQLEIETVYDKNSHSSHFRTVIDSVRVYYPIVKFVSVTLISGLLDFIFLLILRGLGVRLLYAVVLSRLFSVALNLILNNIFVFSHKRNSPSTALRYVGFALGILIVNYPILRFLTGPARIPLSIAKILTEVGLWFFGFWLKKLLSFSHKEQPKM